MRVPPNIINFCFLMSTHDIFNQKNIFRNLDQIFKEPQYEYILKKGVLLLIFILNFKI